MIRTAFRNLWRMPFTTALGALFGAFVVIIVPTVVGPLQDVYDEHFPVLRMGGKVVSRTGDAVHIHISGEKLRGDECRLLSVYGYGIMADGRLTDAIAERVDLQQSDRVRDKGHYDIGVWRVQPVEPGAAGAKVVTQHSCVGRIVLSTIADVKL